MAQDVTKPLDDEEPKEGAEGGAETETQQGFVKKLLGNRKLLMIAGGGALLVLLLVGAGLYFFVFSGTPKADAQTASIPDMPKTPPQVAFYDVPDLIVNIQTSDGTSAYLKLSISLELYTNEEKAGLQALMPRIVDQFQGYLRELRVDDLKGSAGIMRLKEELLRRTNVAAAPYRIRDVLLKEMIVQ